MSLSKYKHLFFDLDHTLYDFEKSSENTLRLIFEEYKLEEYWSFKELHLSYKLVNERLWTDYRKGLVSKDQLKVNRFLLTLREKQECSVSRAKDLSDFYLSNACKQPTLILGALDVVKYLHSKYQLHIITNGFVEVQFHKMDCTGLSPYFNKIFISEKIGAAKPSSKFFQHAIRSCNARKSESLIIGDNWDADIEGAINFKVDAVWFNPDKTERKLPNGVYQKVIEISKLDELEKLL